MISKELVLLLNKYIDEVLQVIEDQMSTDGRDLSQSDLQGRIGAIVMNIFNEGKKFKDKG